MLDALFPFLRHSPQPHPGGEPRIILQFHVSFTWWFLVCAWYFIRPRSVYHTQGWKRLWETLQRSCRGWKRWPNRGRRRRRRRKSEQGSGDTWVTFRRQGVIPLPCIHFFLSSTSVFLFHFRQFCCPFRSFSMKSLIINSGLTVRTHAQRISNLGLR